MPESQFHGNSDLLQIFQPITAQVNLEKFCDSFLTCTQLYFCTTVCWKASEIEISASLNMSITAQFFDLLKLCKSSEFSSHWLSGKLSHKSKLEVLGCRRLFTFQERTVLKTVCLIFSKYFIPSSEFRF